MSMIGDLMETDVQNGELLYRALVPVTIDNLLVAGRCVSAEFNAQAGVRVIATCMSTGQAAGTAAALCLSSGDSPRELGGRVVRKTMIAQGSPLDKEPDGHWATAKEMGDDYVVGPGDFIWFRTAEGVARH